MHDVANSNESPGARLKAHSDGGSSTRFGTQWAPSLEELSSMFSAPALRFLKPLVFQIPYLVAFGLVYCYIASAPILVLHAGRFLLKWPVTPRVRRALNSIAGILVLTEIVILLPAATAFSWRKERQDSLCHLCVFPVGCCGRRFHFVSSGLSRVGCVLPQRRDVGVL